MSRPSRLRPNRRWFRAWTAWSNFATRSAPAAKQFLPRLQSAFLVENAEAAERLARENPAYNFLTPDGTCYQGRAVTGGRPAEAGPLV